MNWTYPLVTFATAAVAIAMIIKNHADSTYNTSQDSAIIPIASVFIVFFILIGTHFTQRLLNKISPTSKTGKAFQIALLTFTPAASFILTVVSAIYWLTPNHMAISFFYSLNAIFLIAHQMVNLKIRPH
ncbi:hypothetical protein [Pseudomonas sp. S2_C03]